MIIALYLAVRFLYLLLMSVFNYNLYIPAATLLFVFTLALVAKFQPYKCKRNNTTDIIVLLSVISACISLVMVHAGGVMYPRWLSSIIVCIAMLIFFGYQLFLILIRVLPQSVHCYKTCKTFLMSKLKVTDMIQNVENQALVHHGSAGYNSCSEHAPA